MQLELHTASAARWLLFSFPRTLAALAGEFELFCRQLFSILACNFQDLALNLKEGGPLVIETGQLECGQREYPKGLVFS